MEVLTVILASLFSAAVLFVIAKIIGHKQVAQLEFFDYITGITIGSIAAELATTLDKPWWKPTISMLGKLYRKNMKKSKLELSEFLLLCRQEGYFNLDDIQTAVYEYNGKLSILPVSAKRPLNPEDVNIAPELEHIGTEVIMDGRIIGDNLSRKGLNEIWLKKELRKQGCKNAKEIFLGICGKDNQLTLYPVK